VSVERILDPLNGTLLSSLIGVERITFVGDRGTIEYLRRFFGAAPSPSSHEYVFVEGGTTTPLSIPADRHIVIASAQNENAIFELVSRQTDPSASRPAVLRLFADLFVNLACHDPLFQPAEQPVSRPPVSYAIVGTPRCGSEFLCDALRATGQAGFPEEHLRMESQLLTHYSGFDCLKYFRALMSRRTTPNGVFGTKIISHFLIEHLRHARGLRRELRRLQYVHIVRQDRVGQAISAMIAEKAGIWHLRSNDDRDRYRRRLESMTIDEQDLLQVDRLLTRFRSHDRKLARFLRKHRLPAMTVTYEDLTGDPARHLTSILSFLHLDVRATDVTVGVEPTRSTLSDLVRARYSESIYGRRRSRATRLLRALGIRSS
jgi:trehalose 2-sulfotransferase